MLQNQLQQSETIEFLKTRLMERDRQISDFETKSKKIQLKHIRDLKEAKIAEQRSKNLLKQERIKSDKYLKQLKESQEQIIQLSTRITGVLKQKEKEVSQIRSLYNSIKEQIRKYERILPTLTFLNQFGLNIENIPPYQDIFINLKDKIVQLQETILSYQLYKTKSEEIISSIKQNEEDMRGKKLEMQKNLNEMISKVLEQQVQISQLQIVENELRQKTEELQTLYQGECMRSRQLQRQHKQHEQKIVQLSMYYSSQLQNKEEEIRKIAQQQFSRLQNQIQSLQTKFQMKEKMYLKQISILQDEVYFLQGQISEEKLHFQENYIQIKQQIEKMREEVEQEREAHEQLKQRYEQIVRSLIKVGRHNEQLQLKVQNLQRKISMFEEKQRKMQSTPSDVQISQIRQLQQSYDQLLYKYTQANNIISALKQTNSYLQEETANLRSQVVSKMTPDYPHRLQLPSSFLDFQNLLKKTQNQYQTANNSQQSLKPDYIENIPEQSFNNKLSIKQGEKVHLLEFEINVLKQKNMKIQDQLLEQISANEKMTKEATNMKKQREKYFEQIRKLKQKNAQLTRLTSQKDKQMAHINKNISMLKEKLQFLTINQQSFKQKLAKQLSDKNMLKQEINRLKELKIEENVQTKRIKELSSQIQMTKRQNEKLRTDWQLKENTLEIQIGKLKKQIEEQIKNANKKYKLNAQIDKFRQQSATLHKKINKAEMQNSYLSRQIEANEQELQTKQREIMKLIQSLARERKERSLLSVPSLQVFNKKNYDQEIQKSEELIQRLKSKDEKIHYLQRQILDLKEQIQDVKMAEKVRLEAVQTEHNYYIHQIIEMKVKCAESEMKAAEFQHIYNLLKRKSSKSTL